LRPIALGSSHHTRLACRSFLARAYPPSLNLRPWNSVATYETRSTTLATP
jgi:hypothetical protein